MVETPTLQINRNDMPNYLLLSSHFLPNDGGIARLMTELTNQFKKRNVDFSAILLEKEEVHVTPEIHRIHAPRGLKEIIAYNKIKNHKGIIISALWYPDGLIAGFSEAEKKVILVHGSELLPNPNKFKEFFLKPLRRKTLRKADLIVANSTFTAKLVKENFGVKNVKVINPGVDVKRFSPGDKGAAKRYFNTGNKFVLSTLSVIRRHKGLKIIFEALAMLPEEVKQNIILLVGGKGDAVAYYRKICMEKGIENLVRWVGFVAESDLPDFYRASDLFLLTSQTKNNAVEGFGMVLTEAQACGVPVIGTRSGGISDAVKEGEGGFLVEEEDSKSLAELIKKYFHIPDELSEIGRRARQSAKENRSWARYTEELIQLL